MDNNGKYLLFISAAVENIFSKRRNARINKRQWGDESIILDWA